MQTLYKSIFAHLVNAIVICLFLASCDMNTLSPEEKVLELLNNNNYSVLSEEDRMSIAKQQFVDLNIYGINPRTTIGSKYHALERFILKHDQYKIVSSKIDQSTQATIVTVRQRYLTIHNKLYFLDSGPSDADIADRLVKQLSEGALEFSEGDFSYSEPVEFTVRNSGVFIDVKGILSYNKASSARSAILEQLPTIYSASQTPTTELYRFDSLWKLHKEEIESLDAQILANRPELAESLRYAYSKALKVEQTLKNIELLKSDLIFRDLNISKSDQGKLAIFGKYETRKLFPFSLAFCIATFKNGETVIGSYVLTCASSLDKSTVGKVAVPIVNQELAKKSKTVSFEPIDYRLGVACKNLKHYECN